MASFTVIVRGLEVHYDISGARTPEEAEAIADDLLAEDIENGLYNGEVNLPEEATLEYEVSQTEDEEDES